MELKRFDFSNTPELSKISQDYLDTLVGFHKLNEPIRKDDFVTPEDSNLDVAYKALLSQVSYLGMDMHALGALIQRVVWMDNEIRDLKRKNRNIRSKNNRLQGKSNGQEQRTEAAS